MEGIGPLVWRREHVWQTPTGRWWRSQERFFWTPVPLFEPRFNQVSAEERATLGAMRWWSLEDIDSGVHTFAPRRLARVLRPLLEGEFPAVPLDVGL